MVNHFHDVLFLEDTSKNYYISGAPQCWFPDPNLSDAFASSWFDFIFVQLYNNQGCNALASYNDVNIDFLSYTLPGLVSTFSRNPDVRVFAGLVSFAGPRGISVRSTNRPNSLLPLKAPPPILVPICRQSRSTLGLKGISAGAPTLVVSCSGRPPLTNKARIMATFTPST